MNEILAAVWFFLPAGYANASPVAAALLPGIRRLTAPMDFGKTYRGRRIFGANKTWRGLITGMLVATLVIGIQKYLFTRNMWVLEHSWFDYRMDSVWLLGPLFGAGALVADAVESFFKRARGVPPGESWFPWDQLDYIIGGCLFSMLIVRLSWREYAWVFVAWFGIHLLTVYIFYLLKIREKPI